MKLLTKGEAEALTEFIKEMTMGDIESYLDEVEYMVGWKPQDNPLRSALKKLKVI